MNIDLTIKLLDRLSRTHQIFKLTSEQQKVIEPVVDEYGSPTQTLTGHVALETAFEKDIKFWYAEVFQGKNPIVCKKAIDRICKLDRIDRYQNKYQLVKKYIFDEEQVVRARNQFYLPKANVQCVYDQEDENIAKFVYDRRLDRAKRKGIGADELFSFSEVESKCIVEVQMLGIDGPINAKRLFDMWMCNGQHAILPDWMIRPESITHVKPLILKSIKANLFSKPI